MKSHAIVCALIISSASAQAQNASCDALLRGGVFDTRVDQSSTDFESSFKNFFCSRAQKSAAGNGGQNLEVNIFEVVSIGGSGTNASTQSELNEMCSSNFNWSKISQQTRLYISKASDIVVNGYNQCMNAKGLHSSLNYSATPGIFNVGVNYIWSGVPGDTTTLETSHAAQTNAICAIPKGTKITTSTTYFVCKQSDINHGSQVILYFEPGQSSTPISVPAAFKDWAPRSVGPGTITTSEGYTIYISQIGKDVSWQLDSPVFMHNFSGRFTSEDELSGVQIRTNKMNGCSVKQAYHFKVPENFHIQGDAKLLPLNEQPGNNYCDLAVGWTNILDLRIVPR